MGIPAYFRHLIKNYNDIVFRLQDSKYHFDNVDRIFFDLNCAIHPCAKKIIDNYTYCKSKKQSYENKIIKATIDYIIKIINITNPKELVYIAIDGVAPRAKMEQQRTRRFKSIKEKSIIRDIKRQYDTNYKDSEVWDTNAITPGTIFMDKLSRELKNFIMYNKLFTNLKVIFSDANNPGEGEHKIMNYLKNNNNFIDVIYGLDADLIMLAMIPDNNIYLLRESLHFGKSLNVDDVDFLYLDIKKLQNYLLQEFEKLIEGPYDNYGFKKALIDDYIFLCFLLGNDFIPHSPSLSIKNDGVDILLNTYKKVYDRYGKNLVNRETLRINHKMLSSIFRELYNLEDSLLIKKSKKQSKFRANFNKCETLLERKLEEFNKYPLFHKDLERKLKLGENNWIERYYRELFLIDRENYKIPCKNFIEALVWTFKYYFSECSSWNWYYKYRHAPPFEDLCKYLEDDLLDINNIRFKKSIPYTPFRQLFTVLPHASADLMPKSYNNLILSDDIRIASYFPRDFKVDTLFNIFYWQCLPILPIIDNDLIFKIIKKLELTKEEKHRNKMIGIFKNF